MLGAKIDTCLAGSGLSYICFQAWLPVAIGVVTFILIVGRIIAVYYEVKLSKKELEEKDD